MTLGDAFLALGSFGLGAACALYLMNKFLDHLDGK